MLSKKKTIILLFVLFDFCKTDTYVDLNCQSDDISD